MALTILRLGKGRDREFLSKVEREMERKGTGMGGGGAGGGLEKANIPAKALSSRHEPDMLTQAARVC